MASIVGVAGLAVLLVGVPLAIAVKYLYASQEVLRLERQASETRQMVDPSALGTGDPIELTRAGAVSFAVYDAAGRRIAGNGPAIADDPVRRALLGNVRDARESGNIVVAVPVNGNERVAGVVRASKSASYLTDRIRRTWLVMGMIGAAALTIAALLALFLARRLTQPVDALVTAAERLGAGDFSVRTGPSGVEELDHLGHALDTTAERLGGLVARERAFSADASHQLRTPLAGLRVHVESSLADPRADMRASLAGTLEPIDRLEGIVDSLLRLARDAHVDRSPLDVARLVADVGRDWHGPLASAGRPLRVTIGSDLPQPSVSEPAIRQILNVLVENAAQHGRGVVTVAVRRVSGAVAVEVSDEGPLALDPIRIFRRRNGIGHGIGLALARTLAEAEGGRLVLERPGPAPKFALLLPARPS
ncbi:MAG TPA: HAMP domain-containing sensor histidine kinase [Acidimicrobiia bacterium]|nr:HAMP domain-containing sensor histidine kinase [Acidimicrobiia bacterium]